MTFKHWIIERRKHILRWLLTKAGLTYGTLDTEQAIRDAYRKGIEVTEKKYAGQRQMIYTLEPLTPVSPIVHVDPIGQRQMYHREKVDMPPGDYFKARHKEFLPTGELPSVKPAWLKELVQQEQEVIVMRCDATIAEEDRFLIKEGEVTGWSETVKSPRVRKKAG